VTISPDEALPAAEVAARAWARPSAGPDGGGADATEAS